MIWPALRKRLNTLAEERDRAEHETERELNRLAGGK